MTPTPDTRLPEEIRGDGPCKICETVENIIWFTDSDLWNKLNIPGILCIACFVKEIYSHGVNPTGWKLVPEDRVNAPDTRLREAARKLLDAEWMVTHDWGGDRQAVIDDCRAALAKCEAEKEAG